MNKGTYSTLTPDSGQVHVGLGPMSMDRIYKTTRTRINNNNLSFHKNTITDQCSDLLFEIT